jgi:hypothetical protein
MKYSQPGKRPGRNMSHLKRMLLHLVKIVEGKQGAPEMQRAPVGLLCCDDPDMHGHEIQRHAQASGHQAGWKMAFSGRGGRAGDRGRTLQFGLRCRDGAVGLDLLRFRHTGGRCGNRCRGRFIPTQKKDKESDDRQPVAQGPDVIHSAKIHPSFRIVAINAKWAKIVSWDGGNGDLFPPPGATTQAAIPGWLSLPASPSRYARSAFLKLQVKHRISWQNLKNTGNQRVLQKQAG